MDIFGKLRSGAAALGAGVYKPQPLALPYYMVRELEAIRDRKPSPTGRDQSKITPAEAESLLSRSFCMHKP